GLPGSAGSALGVADAVVASFSSVARTATAAVGVSGAVACASAGWAGAGADAAGWCGVTGAARRVVLVGVATAATVTSRVGERGTSAGAGTERRIRAADGAVVRTCNAGFAPTRCPAAV